MSVISQDYGSEFDDDEWKNWIPHWEHDVPTSFGLEL